MRWECDERAMVLISSAKLLLFYDMAMGCPLTCGAVVPWLVKRRGKNGWRWSFSEKFRKTPPKKCAIVRHSAPAQKGAFENLQHSFIRSNFAASFVSASDGVSVFIPRGNTEKYLIIAKACVKYSSLNMAMVSSCSAQLFSYEKAKFSLRWPEDAHAGDGSSAWWRPQRYAHDDGRKWEVYVRRRYRA